MDIQVGTYREGGVDHVGLDNDYYMWVEDIVGTKIVEGNRTEGVGRWFVGF